MYYKYLADEHGRSQNGNLKYLEGLREIARKFRNNPTETEAIFWKEILQFDKSNYRFLRQKPLNRFILDFYCPRLLLAIEIDGDSHDKKAYQDRERDIYLGYYNIKTIRYTVDQVKNNLEIIRNDLFKTIKERVLIVF